MTYLQQLHVARRERLARMSMPLPTATPRPRKPPPRIIVIVGGRQMIPPPPPQPEPEMPPEEDRRPRPPVFQPITIREIMDAVAVEFGIHPRSLRDKCRANVIVKPRHVAMYFIRRLTNYSLPEIGKRVGGFDHTSVLNGVRRTEKRILDDRDMAAKVSAIEAKLTEILAARAAIAEAAE